MNRLIRMRPELQAPQVFLLGALFAAVHSVPVNFDGAAVELGTCRRAKALVTAYAHDQAHEIDRLVSLALKQLDAQGRVS